MGGERFNKPSDLLMNIVYILASPSSLRHAGNHNSSKKVIACALEALAGPLSGRNIPG